MGDPCNPSARDIPDGGESAPDGLCERADIANAAWRLFSGKKRIPASGYEVTAGRIGPLSVSLRRVIGERYSAIAGISRKAGTRPTDRGDAIVKVDISGLIQKTSSSMAHRPHMIRMTREAWRTSRNSRPDAPWRRDGWAGTLDGRGVIAREATGRLDATLADPRALMRRPHMTATR